ncbi:unnamed protein product [Arabis nemorensis]|uniref:Uncharacterized protein n=1 Tax=Arabis nemorensis TaxID=586526 RepID=A0A565BTK2_9BRAS|nr:unnamed protein product [Arabis nemorensis]
MLEDQTARVCRLEAKRRKKNNDLRNEIGCDAASAFGISRPQHLGRSWHLEQYRHLVTSVAHHDIDTRSQHRHQHHSLGDIGADPRMTSALRVPDFGTACAPHRYRVFPTSVPRVPHIGTVCSRLRYRVFSTSVLCVPDIGTACS